MALLKDLFVKIALSQLGLRFEREDALNGHFATLLSLSGKDNVVAIFPHLDNQGFAWEYVRGEPRIDLTNTLWVCG